MKIFENYNTAKQKYGIEVVKQLSELGLPPQYLLSACRFIKNYNVPLQRMVNQFKEWTKYVIRFSQYDVNRLAYDDFLKILSQEKSKHIVPNLIWQNDKASFGRLNNAKDVQSIPVKNQWCIKSQRWFNDYISKGYVFFVIYLPSEPLPFTFVVAAICNGNVEYYNTQDYEQFEDLRGGNEGNSDHEQYQRKLPQQIVSYLYDIAANQTENKGLNTEQYMNKKQVIRLTESDIHRIVKESVNKVLTELDWKTYANAANKVKTNYNSHDEYKIALKLFNDLGYDESERWKVNRGDTFRECLAKAHKIASQKSREGFDRYLRFNDAAKDRFNKEYGFEDETGKVELTTGYWDGGGTSWHADMRDRNGNMHGYSRYFVTDQNFYGQNGQHTPGKWCVGTVGWAGAVPASPDFDTPDEAQAYADEHNMSTEINAASDKLQKAYHKAKEETTKYDPYNGTSSSWNNPKYKYEKGNGWVFDGK